MKESLVSVVLSTTGENQQLLGLAIDSMFNQQDVEVEVVVVLDGASFGVRQFLEQRYKSCPLRILESAKRRGLSRSLNAGIRIASGAYIARMDDDDISCPRRLATQLEFMIEHDLDVVGADAEIIDENGACVGGIIRSNRFHLHLSPYELYFKSLFVHPTVVMKKQWATANKYDPTWGRGQDRELWVRTYSSSRFGAVPVVLLQYRRSGRVKRAQFDNLRSLQRLLERDSRSLRWRGPLFSLANRLRSWCYRCLAMASV